MRDQASSTSSLAQAAPASDQEAMPDAVRDFIRALARQVARESYQIAAAPSGTSFRGLSMGAQHDPQGDR